MAGCGEEVESVVSAGVGAGVVAGVALGPGTRGFAWVLGRWRGLGRGGALAGPRLAWFVGPSLVAAASVVAGVDGAALLGLFSNFRFGRLRRLRCAT